MPGALIGGLIGTAAGGVKSLLGAGKVNRERHLAAETTRYSPWTGLKGTMPEESNPLGDMISGGTAGATFGQNISEAGKNPWDNYFSAQQKFGVPPNGMSPWGALKGPGGPSLGVNTNLGY